MGTRETERPSLAKYIKAVFEDSLLTGVPQILLTRSLPRKVLKSIVLCCCLVGFVYQTTEFLKIFWNYPTVLDIDVEYPEVIESPAISFCNLNGIKRKSFCGAFPERCSSPVNVNEFCVEVPNACKRNEPEFLTYPRGDALEEERNIADGHLKTFGHMSNDTLTHCRRMSTESNILIPCRTNETIHTVMSDGNGGYRNCHTLFTNIGSRHLHRYMLPVPKTGKSPLFHLVFDLQSEEYFRPDREVGGIVSIHSPNSLVNPFSDGFVVKPGNLYTVHLKVLEEKLLPSPYETQCRDYKAMWNTRGGRGPLNQEMCIAECIYNASMAQCGCVEPDVLYLHNDKVCSSNEVDECLSFNASECYEICQQSCEFTDFEYNIQERKLETHEVHSVEDFYAEDPILKNKAVILVFLKRPEIIIFSHRPQYEDIEVFSYLGGYVGMWLGISLVAVFDFFEHVTLVTIFWIRRKIQMKQETRSTALAFTN